MSEEQLGFTQLIAEADATNQAQLHRHRAKVFAWFEQLPRNDKLRLAQWMGRHQWETCEALATAAGDWLASRHNGKRQ
jgi:hypothetical protein